MSFERKRQERKEKKRTKISLLDPDNDEKKNRDVSQSVFFSTTISFLHENQIPRCKIRYSMVVHYECCGASE